MSNSDLNLFTQDVNRLDAQTSLNQDGVIKLTGLRGNNPMAFLAALGVVISLPEGAAKLSWTDEPTSIAELHTHLSVDEVIEEIQKDMASVAQWELMNQKNFKMDSDQFEVFLQSGTERELQLKAALLSDITVDGSGNPKPTDLYFCAGQQSFMGIAKELSDTVTEHELREALFGPWRYKGKKRGTFMWDTRDDRNYALMATNPVTTDKQTEPGADWLAFRGLQLLPSFGTIDRIHTPGTSGGWKRGHWAWVLWKNALGSVEIRTVMQSIPRGRAFDTWVPVSGVFRAYQSQIVRSDQGGYGTIRPPRQVWME